MNDLEIPPHEVELLQLLEQLKETLRMFLMAICSMREVNPHVIRLELAVVFNRFKSILKSDPHLASKHLDILIEINYLCSVLQETFSERLDYENELLRID